MIATASAHLSPEAITHEIRYAYGFYAEKWRSLPQATIDEVRQDFLAYSKRLRPLAAGESGVVTLFKPKTAALLADRVWLQYPGDDPRLDFGFGFESPIAVRLAALFAFIRLGGDLPEEANDVPNPPAGPASQFVIMTEGDLTADYRRRCAAEVVPLYRSQDQLDAAHKQGDFPTIVSVVENVALVSEGALTWEQVLEFRKDSSARVAYRRFVHWLDGQMVGKSESYICDEVAAKLERYEWALRKHGLETVIGTLQRTTSLPSLLGTSAAAAATQTMLNQPLVATLAGLSIMLGNAALHTASALIQREDLLMANREVAFVHNTRERLASHAPRAA